MTREIKFRIWDKKEGKMYDKDNLIIKYDPSIASDIYTYRINEFFNSDKNTERWEFMQYTGLKDKNGKDIYFGDIIRYIDVDGNGAENCIGEVVETMNYGVGILTDGVISDLWEDEYVHQFEVIGNIYENPELIKQSNA